MMSKTDNDVNAWRNAQNQEPQIICHEGNSAEGSTHKRNDQIKLSWQHKDNAFSKSDLQTPDAQLQKW